MAYPGKQISNRYTGQSIRFIQTAKDTEGQLLEMESVYNSHSSEPAAHFHPYQDEWFTVMQGELTVKVEGKIKTLKAGEELHIPRNTVHAMWNNTAHTTVVHWKVVPALETEEFLENAMGLAADGRTSRSGMPSLLQVVLMAKRYEAEFRLSKPPVLVQNIIFSALRPIARMAGLQASYKKYID